MKKYRFVVKKQLEFWEIQYHSELDEKTFSFGDIKEAVRYCKEISPDILMKLDLSAIRSCPIRRLIRVTFNYSRKLSIVRLNEYIDMYKNVDANSLN